MSILLDIQKDKENIQNELRADMRGLADRFREMDEPAGFQMSESFSMGDIPPRINVGEALRSSVGWVYACAAVIADAIAKNGIWLYEVGNGGDITPVESHPSLEVLDRVNDFTTKYDHMWLSQQYLELAGESPWLVDRGQNGDQDPRSILLLRPDLLSIVQASDKKSANPISGYKYKIDGNNSVDIKLSELVFLKYPDTANPFRGKGTLMAAASSVDLDHYAEDWNRKFFYNSARPDSILKTEQKLSDKQKQSLRSDINRLYKGKDKAHAVAILEAGLDWKPMSLSQKDMEYLEQQRFSRDKIFGIFRVHKTILGLTEDVNLANAKVGEYVFAKWTIKPKLERIVAQLNEFYLPMFQDAENLFFSFDDPVPQDADSRIALYGSALDKGWMTRNEVRREENLEDVGEAGDQLLVPNTLTPIDMSGMLGLTQDPAAGKSFNFKPPTSIKLSSKDAKGIISRSGGGYHKALLRMTKMQEAVKQKTEVVKEIDSRIMKIATAMAERVVKREKKISANLKSDETNKKQQFADVYLKAVSKYERLFKISTQLIFESQKEKILRRFPQKAAVNVDDYLLDEEDETQVMVRIYDPLVRNIVLEQGKRAARLAGSGSTFDMATEAVRAYLANRTFKFAGEINEETNRRLSAQLQEGVKLGEGITELRKRVESVFTDMSKSRAERIARSEVIRASNFAANEAYDQSGVVEKLEWLVTDDDRTCPFCAPLDGKTVGLGKSFFDKGDKITAENGSVLDLDYENIDFPPLHPNCRCTIVPVIK